MEDLNENTTKEEYYIELIIQIIVLATLKDFYETSDTIFEI